MSELGKQEVGAAAPPPSDLPFLRFYHSKNLRANTLAVLATLEQAQDCTRYSNALTDIVMELTDSGLDYYFMRPLKIVNMGFVIEQSAQLGMASVKRVIAPVIRNVIGHMDAQQLLSVCAYVRQLMD